MNNEPAGTILVIDDEQPFCEVVAEILTTFGYPVRTAFNAAQALDVLGSVTPILIILDIMMPDVDGLTLVRRFRADPRLSKIPVIMSSAKYLKEDRTEAINAGASAYLTKPFSAAELRSSIIELLGEREPQLTLKKAPGYTR
ncbi:MAG: response regulator [Anaerolineales bacterium]|nr:response regulator [Anaerolineales bacterium]